MCIFISLGASALCRGLCVCALIGAQIRVDACVRINALACPGLCRAYVSLRASLERFLAALIVCLPEPTVAQVMSQTGHS